MSSFASSRPQSRRLSLQLPLIVLLLAFTAVPAELSSPRRYLLRGLFNPRFAPFDVVTNILGYVPIGAVLATMPFRHMLWTATAVSAFAEATQVFSQGRSPSIVDIATNILGAAIGWALCQLVNVRPRDVKITKTVAALAAIGAVAYLTISPGVTPSDVEDTVAAFIAAPPWLKVSDRGATAPGQLEAHWTLDSVVNGTTPDSSSNGLTGKVVNDATLAKAIVAQGVDFNGREAIDVGNPIALRLTGSMTITAWIKPRDYLENANAIVSNMNRVGRGFQFDVTTDEGPPAIGFKLTDSTGRRMARYGSTRLRRNYWYHVAGVYDAHAQTLNVFLNGRADNFCLQGEVSATQRTSGVNTFIGARRARNRFTGIIDDLKIYSRALTADEIAAEVGHPDLPSFALSPDTSYTGPCPSRPLLDARVAGFTVGLGMLVATACVGLWPTTGFRRPALTLGLLAGVALLLISGADMPPLMRGMVPLLTFAGAASIVFASRS